MNLIGITVKHALWGIGTVIKFDGKNLTVELQKETKLFVYPDSFEKFLKAENTTIQSSIDQEIELIKQIAFQKRHTEENDRNKTEAKRYTTVAAARRAKRIRNIDKMFAADYHAEKLSRHPILTYQEVEEQFGIRISGFGRGINPTDHTVVLISSIGNSNGKFVYHEKWTEEGDYIFW